MNDKVGFQRDGFNRRDVLKTAGVSLAAAAALSRVPAFAQSPVQLTLWSWLPNFQDQVSLFEAAHPNIKVNLVNAGQGGDEYTKLRAALKAGSGLPDVCHLEFQLVRSFEQLKALADIGPSANAHKDEFAAWAWSQVSDGDKVYAMPWDSGPIAVLYRNDVFEKYNLTVPKTWAEFADQAIKLHEAAPDVFLTDATFSDGGWTTSLLWQAGWRPFEVNGAEIRIQVNGDVAKKFRRLLAEADRREGDRSQARLRDRMVHVARRRPLRHLAHRRLGPCLSHLLRQEELGQMARCANSAVGREQVGVGQLGRFDARRACGQQTPEGSGRIGDLADHRSQGDRTLHDQTIPLPDEESDPRELGIRRQAFRVLWRTGGEQGVRRVRQSCRSVVPMEPVPGLRQPDHGRQTGRRRGRKWNPGRSIRLAPGHPGAIRSGSGFHREDLKALIAERQ